MRAIFGMRAILVALLAVSACDSSGGPTDTPDGAAAIVDAGPVGCSAQTCGEIEYCLASCMRTQFPDASILYECRPIPDGCTAEDLCSCASILAPTGYGSCDQSQRRVYWSCT